MLPPPINPTHPHYGLFTTGQWGLFVTAIVLFCLVVVFADLTWQSWKVGARRREAWRGLREYQKWKAFHPGEKIETVKGRKDDTEELRV